MVVSLDYELAPTHQSIVDSPEIVQTLKATMMQELRIRPSFVMRRCSSRKRSLFHTGTGSISRQRC